VRQGASGFQETALSGAEFELGRKTFLQGALDDVHVLVGARDSGIERFPSAVNRAQIVRDPFQVERCVCFQLVERKFVHLANGALPRDLPAGSSIVDDPPGVGDAPCDFRGNDVIRTASRPSARGVDGHGNTGSGKDRVERGIILGFNDSLVFLGRMDHEPRELEVGALFQRGRRFRGTS
jgi:hypothetical protein